LPKCIKPPLIQYFISRYSYVYQITSNSTIWLLFRHNFQIGKILVRCIHQKIPLYFLCKRIIVWFEKNDLSVLPNEYSQWPQIVLVGIQTVNVLPIYTKSSLSVSVGLLRIYAVPTPNSTLWHVRKRILILWNAL